MRKRFFVVSAASCAFVVAAGVAVAGNSTPSADPSVVRSQVDSVENLPLASAAQGQALERSTAFARRELGELPVGPTRIDGEGALVRLDQSGGCLRVDGTTACAPADVVARGGLTIQGWSHPLDAANPMKEAVLVSVDGVAPDGADAIVATDRATGKAVRAAVVGGVYHLRGRDLSNVGVDRGGSVTAAKFVVDPTKP